jgi:hypothetical protein
MSKSFLNSRPLPALLVGAMIWAACIAPSAYAQRALGTIEAGTTIAVRTSETINANGTDGRVFEGEVVDDVLNRNGSVAIPRGSPVELVVKNVTDTELAVDLSSVTVNNQRYGLETGGSAVTGERRDGIGVNERTGKYVGGGALLGAVVGAIAGGKKGAAIGAGAGAAAGAGTQILTRGKSVRIPAESLLTFRLQQPLRTSSAVSGAGRYDLQNDQVTSSAAYRAGVQAGRSDADRNLARNVRSERFRTGQQRADYEAGYHQGYDNRLQSQSSQVIRQKPTADDLNGSSIRIGRDNNIRWQAPATARVYVMVDNEPMKLFAEGQSGTQEAPWIQSGHLYVFVMQDLRGNEIARDRLDLRGRRR